MCVNFGKDRQVQLKKIASRTPGGVAMTAEHVFKRRGRPHPGPKTHNFLGASRRITGYNY
uniref:Ribosomal protein L2 n=1 Tax=Romanomermis culicivorax TaxID=13658 RepID=A0A915IXL5_ROMCU